MVGGDKEDEGFTDEGVKVEMIGVEGWTDVQMLVKLEKTSLS